MSIAAPTVERPVPHHARALLASVRQWVRLARQGRLRGSSQLRGARLRFADGTESFVFRETVMSGTDLTAPCVLIVSFRLRLLGRATIPHALFRYVCVVNTPLFAGFAGFATKLWLADSTTRVYRGVYDWNDPVAARDYAEALCALLRLGSVPGTVRYHVVAGMRREAYLAGEKAAGGEDGWWKLREPMIPPEHTRG